MMKRNVGFCFLLNFALLLLSLFGLSNLAFSQEKEYTLAVEDINYFPFHGFEKGELGGYLKDVLDAFSKDTKIKFKILPLPMLRGWKEFLEGTVDFKYPDNPSWSQDKKAGIKVVYSNSVIQYTDGFSTLKTNQEMPLKDLNSFTAVLGFNSWGKEVDDLIQKKVITVESTKSLDSSVQQVLLGRAQAVYSEINVVQNVMKTKNFKGELSFNKNLPHVQGSYFLSTIKHTNVITQLNEWLEKNKGRVEEIKKKHGFI